MQKYYEYNFNIQPGDIWVDVFMAEFSALDFESFIEEGDVLKGYTTNANLEPEIINIINQYKDNNKLVVSYTINEIEPENWNQNWENNFEPITINEWCIIKAPFHNIEKKYPLEITIIPKMSFGTGHHQTTFLMLQQMKEIDFKNKKVLDMGCGTGILAIAAKKLGSNLVDGVDIEEWAYENAIENAEKNEVKINFFLGDEKAIINNDYDVILANINKNILLQQCSFYKKSIASNGVLLLSGLLSTDENEIITLYENEGFKYNKTYKKDNWICLKFS